MVIYEEKNDLFGTLIQISSKVNIPYWISAQSTN